MTASSIAPESPRRNASAICPATIGQTLLAVGCTLERVVVLGLRGGRSHEGLAGGASLWLGGSCSKARKRRMARR